MNAVSNCMSLAAHAAKAVAKMSHDAEQSDGNESSDGELTAAKSVKPTTGKVKVSEVFSSHVIHDTPRIGETYKIFSQIHCGKQ